MRKDDKALFFPKSSFLSLENDAQIIVSKLLKNERLKKLLYIQDKNCLSLPDLTVEENKKLIDNGYIRFVPKINIDENLMSYIYISFDNFVTNPENPEFRNNTIAFHILCNYDQWNLGDFKLRPFKIAGEVDSMLNDQRLTGVGTINFLGADLNSINETFGGITLVYEIIHGEEDKI